LQEGLANLDLFAPEDLSAAGGNPRGLSVGFRNYERSRTGDSLGIHFSGQIAMSRTVVRDSVSPVEVEHWGEVIKNFR